MLQKSQQRRQPFRWIRKLRLCAEKRGTSRACAVKFSGTMNLSGVSSNFTVKSESCRPHLRSILGKHVYQLPQSSERWPCGRSVLCCWFRGEMRFPTKRPYALLARLSPRNHISNRLHLEGVQSLAPPVEVHSTLFTTLRRP